MGNHADNHRLCPAGTWLCSAQERGLGACATSRPDGTCDFIECTGLRRDVQSFEHRGWTAKFSTSLTSGIVVSETEVQQSGGSCQYYPTWCCSRG